MDKKSALNLANKYAKEVRKELNPEQIVLYGSYASNTYNENSDIDIAVIYNDLNENFLDISSLLWKLTRNVSTLIEPVLLDQTKDKSGFVDEVIRQGKVI